MIGMKRALVLSCSLLLVCTASGSSNVVNQRRQLSKGSSKSAASKSASKSAALKSASKSAAYSYDDMSMSLSMSMPGKGGKEGKGGKGGKGSVKIKKSKSKNADSTKEGKKASIKDGKKASDKTSKKSGKKSQMPSTPSPSGFTSVPEGPTASPVAPTPTTPAPTSANSIPIRVTPFGISYDTTVDRLPSQAEYRELTELTRVYLEEFMFAEFAGTSLTTLDDFITVMIRNSFTAGEPILVEYRSSGLFNPSSIFLPTVRELDGLITRAFTGENLMVYLALVQALPSQNIFSSTSTAGLDGDVVNTITGSSAGATGGGTNTSTVAGIAAGAAGLVVLAAGLILLRRRKTEDEEYDETYGEKGNGDMTVAGETCNMSVDSPPSEMFAPWRDGNLHEDDELEEEDEGEGFERPTSMVATES